ncbi:uncharacterized protein [Montipora capricornis]|uniref:uncharacterized protein n=1 Tax=Montipora foliosa TaxID=591990 RepID=UPI0035F1B742
MNKELMYYCPVKADESRQDMKVPKISETQKNNEECNCYRSPETILCKRCGGSFVGRKRIQCQRHKNIIHLMDCAYCVFCKRQL